MTTFLLPGDRVEFTSGRHDGLTGTVVRVRASATADAWYDVAVDGDERVLWVWHADTTQLRVLAHAA